MKKQYYLTVLLLLSFGNILEAQLKSQIVAHQVWVYPVGASERDFFLTKENAQCIYQTTDSSIVFAATRRRFDPKTTPLHVTPIENIGKLEIRDRDFVHNATLVGLGIGCLVGAAIGYVTYSDPCSGKKFVCIDFGPAGRSIAGAFLGAIPGSLIGVQVGRQLKSFPIEGDRRRYAEQREKLKKLALTGN